MSEKKRTIRSIVIEMEEEFWELWHRHKNRYRLILTTLINNSNLQIMSLSLNQGQVSLGTVGLIDTDTQQAVGATFANVEFTVDDPTVATVEQLSTDPTTGKVTGVAVGTTNVNAKADATYTDSKTNQQVTKTLTVSVPVSVAQVAAENVGLVINFTTPQ